MSYANAFREAAKSFGDEEYTKDQLKSKFFELLDVEYDNHFESYFYNFSVRQIGGVKINKLENGNLKTELHDEPVRRQRNANDRRINRNRTRVASVDLANDRLGKDLDEAIKMFKSSWSSIGGEYVPFCDKYSNIDDVYYNAGMEAYRAATKRAIRFDGLAIRTRNELRKKSCEYLKKRFKILFDLKKMDFDIFRDWAKETAKHIRDIYRNAGVNDYTYGNAQKLINVALKFVLSSNLVDCHNPVFKHCHFPVDGIIQGVIKKNFGIKRLKTCWSKNDNWDEFVEYQKEVRKAVLDNGYYSPLIWEATHWNN